MDKRTEIKVALKDAMKNQDKVALSTVRLITAALKDRDLTAREKGNTQGIADDEILLMLQSMIKQRQESASTYSEAGRDDLAEQEEDEIEVIRRFMPKQLDDEEIEAAIDTAINDIGAQSVKDMGRVMGVLKEKYAGQMDMGKAGGFAKKKLG